MADIQDLYVERFNPDDDRLYEFEGDWRRAEVVREEIRVKGRSKPELLDVKITHHGPIVNDALDASDEQPLALSWTALQYPLLSDVSLGVIRARSGQEVVSATAEHSAPPLNMLWADSAGNIGYKLIGKLPLRRGGCPDLPKPGWTGEFEWDGTVPYEELPEVVNPDSGFLVTANNRIVGDDYPHHITSEWMTGYRARASRTGSASGSGTRWRTSPGFSSTSTLPRASRRSKAVAAAPEDAAGDAGDRVAQELGRTARRRDRRRHHLPRLHARALACSRRGRDPGAASARALPQQVGRRADPRRVVSLALPGPAARALGRG